MRSAARSSRFAFLRSLLVTVPRCLTDTVCSRGDVLLLLALAGISGSLRLSSVFCRFSACASRSCDHATQGTANLAVQHSTTFQKHAQCNLQQDPCPAVTVKALQECVPVWSAASSPKNICCCGLSSTRYVLLPGRPICAQ